MVSFYLDWEDLLGGGNVFNTKGHEGDEGSEDLTKT
jgi:hypothetical protein